MDGREIPGFYFDTDKKKYFKIQKTHQLPPNAKHSASNVIRESRKQKIDKELVLRTQKRRKETIVRRYSPLIQANLNREIGDRIGSYYVRTSWPEACASTLPNTPEIVFEPANCIRFFDRDPVTRNMYIVQADNIVKRRRPNEDADLEAYTSSPSVEDDLSYMYEPWDEVARLTSPISSLTCLPASGALAVTSIGSDRSPMVYLTDPDKDGPYIGQKFTPRGVNTIWGASTWAPTTSDNSVAAADTEKLAVAASSSVLLFTRAEGGNWQSSPVFKTKSDVLTVDWISPYLISMGCRNGKIFLYDTRCKDSSQILRHPCSILTLKHTDQQTQVVCAGIEGAICLYDFRASRSSSTSLNGNSHDNEGNISHRYPNRNGRKRRKLQQAVSTKRSQPIVTYGDVTNASLTPAIDLHPRLGLVAIAHDRSPSAVLLHNLWSGKLIREMRLDKSRPLHSASAMRCLKFMDREDGDGVDLWANCDGGIVRYRT
ncbi:hypothetical protein P280DRAFT_399838 [Massarina eburnea CBS 473.64]|uniref:WD40 repeat-like protein n=1 Tax=Massarina eburnea CBS 473.64 TaxID=1395130 RepID=A0A6A6RZK0_9PLEO|nr:hypothetical protein P280DRAFT_399838 [Massarina eburnea CBS 473.64]